MNSIYKIKKITTNMNLVGTCLSIVLTIFSIFLIIALTNAYNDSYNYLGGDDLCELVAGFQVLGWILAWGGSLVALAFAFILLFAVLLIFISFLVPTISGFKFRKKTENYLSTDYEIFQDSAASDAKLKMVFSSISAIICLYETFSNDVLILFPFVIYYAVIFFLEFKTINKLQNPSAS